MSEAERYDDLVSIEAAARALHRRCSFIRDFARAKNLMIQWPGRKRALIPLSELRAALAEKPKTKQLHPLVKC